VAHHKRRRPKSTRAGCLLCKVHKGNSHKDTWGCQTKQERVARMRHYEQSAEVTRPGGILP